MKYLFLLLLAGCTIFQNPADCIDRGDGLCWHESISQIPVSTYRWEVDTTLNASKRCQYGFRFDNASCVMGRAQGVCWVVSSLSEEAAKRTQAHARDFTTTVFQHEIRDHCGLGLTRDQRLTGERGIQYTHTDGAVSSITGRR